MLGGVRLMDLGKDFLGEKSGGSRAPARWSGGKLPPRQLQYTIYNSCKTLSVGGEGSGADVANFSVAGSRCLGSRPVQTFDHL